MQKAPSMAKATLGAKIQFIYAVPPVFGVEDTLIKASDKASAHNGANRHGLVGVTFQP